VRSQAIAAPEVLADRRRPPGPQSTTSLEFQLGQSQAMCRRHELAIEALTNVVGVLRRGTVALTDENKELRALLARRCRAGQA
jgi:hypothetical protein